MNILLLSHALNNTTPGYGGSQGFQKSTASSISEGRSSNSENWQLSNHSGTHIDCPYHFANEGKKITDYEAKDWFFSKPFLLDYSAKQDEIINLQDAKHSIPKDTDFLIIKTGFEEFRNQDLYWKHNPGLSPELGKWLRENIPSLKIVGFDFISLTGFQNREIGRVSHREFLAPSNNHDGLRVVEDMRLANVKNDLNQIIVSPLFVEKSDGSPVTIWAW